MAGKADTIVSFTCHSSGQIYVTLVESTLLDGIFFRNISGKVIQAFFISTYSEFESGPRTLMGPGECTDDLTLERASSGLMDPHQIWA